MLDAAEFTRLAADRTRLAVLGALAPAPRTAAEVADACRLDARTVQRVLGRLAAAGLVVADEGRYRLDDEALRAVLRGVERDRAVHPAVVSGLDEEEAAVVARYFRGRRLVEIPPGEQRRRAVLRVLLDEFEPGRYYTETEVRRILRKFHPDDAALRRYMVDEGMLARDSTTRTYWRGGGPPPSG